MGADKRDLVPCEHLHSDFQKLQTEKAEMRVTEPSIPPERAGPQAEDGNNKLNKIFVYETNSIHAQKWVTSYVVWVQCDIDMGI